MKKKTVNKILLLIAGAVFLFQSCITPFHPDIAESDSRLLVVEGQITDEEGPFRVRLSNTFDVDNMQLYADPEIGANVQIYDDKGNLYPLHYTNNGWYETSNKHLKGVPGNTYNLNITTGDGAQYESSPVLMQHVPDIGSVYFEEAVRTRFEDGEPVEEKWLDIFLDTKDNAGGNEYWKWDLIETWEVRTPKENVEIVVYPDNAPSYSMFFTLEFREGNVIKGWDNKKERCWVTVPSTSILIEATNNESVNEVVRFPVKTIAPDGDRLHIRYSILVKQTALSKERYSYWKRLRETNEETGGMYDKNPSQVFGNIECCDGKQKALGYFSASSVKTKRIFITPGEHDVKTKDAYSGCGYNFFIPRVLNYYLGHIIAASDPVYENYIGNIIYSTTPWCADCREYGTSAKPSFWVE